MDPIVQPRLLQWWKDNPSDPDRPSLNNPDVQRLISAITRRHFTPASMRYRWLDLAQQAALRR